MAREGHYAFYITQDNQNRVVCKGEEDDYRHLIFDKMVEVKKQYFLVKEKKPELLQGLNDE